MKTWNASSVREKKGWAKFRWFAVTFSLLLGAVAFATGAPADEKEDHCQAVSGSISGNVIGADPTVVLGTVTGSLRGAVTATVDSATPQEDGSIRLELRHVFVTESRDSLKTEDVARWVPVPGANGVFRMTTRYTIVGGTGRFVNATGTLHNFGEADTNTGLLTLGYRGQVCTE